MISVLLVDDHPILRQGLAGLLSTERDIDVIGQASDGASAVEMALRLRPDVVIMDLRLPGVSGAVATEEILAMARILGDGWMPHIVVLTTFEDDDSITEAIEAGATGYLLKSATPEELTAAIRATSEGRAILAPPVAEALVRRVRTGATARVLSNRETEVLRLLGEELSNAEIAERLVLEPSTVKTHIEHIYAKLGISRRTQAIAKAKEMGLVK